MFLLCRSCARSGSLCSRIISSQKVPVRLKSNHHSVFNRTKDFVFASEKENFHEDFVERAHVWDKVDRSEWTLIYRDLGASRSFLMVATFLPAFLIGAVIFSIDIWKNKEADRLEFVQRLVRDCNEIGILVYFPAAALVMVLLLLFRVHQCRVLRIYQKRLEPEKYLSINSRNIVGQQKVFFDRQVTSAFYYADEQTDVLRMGLNFLLGNIQVGNRRFLVIDECFRGNNFKSYMLNETSTPPRL